MRSLVNWYNDLFHVRLSERLQTQTNIRADQSFGQLSLFINEAEKMAALRFGMKGQGSECLGVKDRMRKGREKGMRSFGSSSCGTMRGEDYLRFPMQNALFILLCCSSPSMRFTAVLHTHIHPCDAIYTVLHNRDFSL